MSSTMFYVLLNFLIQWERECFICYGCEWDFLTIFHKSRELIRDIFWIDLNFIEQMYLRSYILRIIRMQSPDHKWKSMDCVCPVQESQDIFMKECYWVSYDLLKMLFPEISDFDEIEKLERFRQLVSDYLKMKQEKACLL